MAWREKSLSSSYGPRKRSRGVPRFFPRCPGLNKSWGLWDKSKGRGKDSSKTWLKLPTNRGQVSHMGLIWRVKAMWHFTDFSAIRKIMLMTRPPPPYLYHRHHPSLPPLSSHLPSACCFVLNDSMCETPTAKLRCIPFLLFLTKGWNIFSLSLPRVTLLHFDVNTKRRQIEIWNNLSIKSLTAEITEQRWSKNRWKQIR